MKILIVTHGNLANGLLESYEMIVGDTSHIETLVLDEDGVGPFREKLKDRLDELTTNEEPVLVLCDLKGGTPFNETLMYSFEKPGMINIISGVNLPILAELSTLTNEEDLTSKLNEIVEIGKNSISLD